MKIFTKDLLQEKYLIPLKILLVYLAWKIFYHFAEIPGTSLNNWWISFVFSLGHIYAAFTGLILSGVGVKASSTGVYINLIESHKQIWVQEHCLAIPAMTIFTGAVVFFKGNAKDKCLFILFGLVGIFLLNTLRLMSVSIAYIYLSPYMFVVHHSFVYVIITYGFIFFMITKWMDRTILKANSNPQ